MADANYPLNTYLPDEIPGHIVQYLTVPQLSLFKQLCKQFNWAASHAVFLQPLYNRLYALDKTLSPSFMSADASNEFKQAFEKIRDRQNAEIEFIVKNFDGLKHLTKILDDCKTIEALENRDAILNNENIGLIDAFISHQGNANHLDLYSCMTRFIIDEKHIAYFKNLTTLSCQNNLITTLNLEDHPNLKLLDCRDNPCLKTVNLSGCSPELDIQFDHSEKPINIFSDNYDYQKKFYDLLKCGARGFFSPTAGALMFGAMCVEMGGEFLATYNTPVPPQIYLDDAEAQNQKDKFANIEEARLFRILNEEKSPNKKAEIIQQLGDRYTTRNCLKYGCLYEASLIMRGTTSTMLEKTSNLLFSYWGAKKEGDSLMLEQEESAKRKREENDGEGEEPENNKKRRLD